MKVFAVFVSSLLFVLPVSAADSTATPLGTWINEKETVVVNVMHCRQRQGLCGEIVWMKKPRRSNGELKRDRENPDPDRRERLLCGLEILHGFTPDGDNYWSDGRIYNPEEGTTYKATLELESRDRLRVRGYVLLPVFGKTLVWRRLAAAPGQCPPAAATETAVRTDAE